VTVPKEQMKNPSYMTAALAVLILMLVAGCAADNGGSADTSTAAVTVDRFVLQPVTIAVMVKPNTSQPQIDGLRDQIEARDDVEEVAYTSQEEALAKLRKRLGDDQDLLPADLAWELSPMIEITLKENADIEAVARELVENTLVDNSPGKKDGVEYETEPWHLKLMSDESFELQMGDSLLSGSYKIYRGSITLIEETGEYGVFEGEITGTSIKFEAFPGIWEKE
jgi:hypothetical protein